MKRGWVCTGRQGGQGYRVQKGREGGKENNVGESKG